MDGVSILPSLMLALLIGSVGALGVTELIKVQVVGTHATPLHATAAAADAWAENTIATFEQSNPTLAITSAAFGSGTTINGIAVTAAVDGDTVTTGSTTTAANLNTTIDERRVAVDITLKTTTAPVIGYEERRIYRVFELPPYVVALDTGVPGAVDDTNKPGGSDTGGCAGTGPGCDQLATQSAGSQLATSAKTCTTGVGSGTCTPGQTFPNSVYTSKNWNDAQSSGQ